MRSTGFRNTARGFAGEVEAELSRLATYLNDAVVPEVKRGSAAGLRVAAEQLGRMAEQLERAPARRRAPGSVAVPGSSASTGR